MIRADAYFIMLYSNAMDFCLKIMQNHKALAGILQYRHTQHKESMKYINHTFLGVIMHCIYMLGQVMKTNHFI